jgi:hypothetical protein
MAFRGLRQRARDIVSRRGQILTCPHLGLGTRPGIAPPPGANPVSVTRRMVRPEGNELSHADLLVSPVLPSVRFRYGRAVWPQASIVPILVVHLEAGDY